MGATDPQQPAQPQPATESPQINQTQSSAQDQSSVQPTQQPQPQQQQQQTRELSSSEKSLLFLRRNTNLSNAMREPYWNDGTASISFLGVQHRLKKHDLLDASIKPITPDGRIDRLHEKLYALRKDFSVDLLKGLITDATAILSDWIDGICPQSDDQMGRDLIREVQMNLESIPGLFISNTKVYPGHMKDFEAKLIAAELIDVSKLDELKRNDPSPAPDNSHAEMMLSFRGKRKY